MYPPRLSVLLATVLGITSVTAQTITVSLSQTYQRIDGFGFSEAFQRANDLLKMPEDQIKKVLDLLFNTTTGAGFTIVRNGIGSSPDSSSDHMNTILPRNPGGPTAKPNYVWDGKDSGQLWFSKQAMTYGVKTFYANAWSAPGFMKSNGNDANGGSLCGVGGTRCSSGDWKQAYADYLVRYVQYYHEEGVPISYLGFLNEPDLSTSYASMQSSGSQAADFIKVLYPTLAAANLSQVGITCCDSAGWSNQAGMLGQLKSAGVENMLARITSHGYTSAPGSPFNTRLPVWQTEWMDNNNQFTTPWYSSGGAGDGFTWARNIHQGLTGSNCTAYFYWVGIQHPSNANSKLITISNDGRTFTVSKRLWAYANWSRFVRPGAIRVGASGASGNLRTSAFKNEDGSVAVQVLNSGTGAATVQVKGVPDARSVTAWVTDNTRDLETIAASIDADGTASGSVPGRSMVSFVLRV